MCTIVSKRKNLLGDSSVCVLSAICLVVSVSTWAAQRVLEIPSFASDMVEAKDASTWAAQRVLKVPLSIAFNTVEAEDASTWAAQRVLKVPLSFAFNMVEAKDAL